MMDKSSKKAYRKASAKVAQTLRTIKGSEDLNDDLVEKLVFVDYRVRINRTNAEAIREEHFRRCSHGRDCDGSCNDYGCP